MPTKKSRITATINDATKARLEYWAEKHNMTINEYIAYAIDIAIAHDSKDFKIPDITVARLNQLIDSQMMLVEAFNNMENIVTNGLESIISLTRGDNYLDDSDSETDEDGDLDV